VLCAVLNGDIATDLGLPLSSKITAISAFLRFFYY